MHLRTSPPSRPRSVAFAWPGMTQRAILNLFVTAVVAALSFFAVARSAAAQETRVITFEEAVRIALEQNVNLRQAANNADLQSRLAYQERMNFLPSLSFSSSGFRGSGFVTDQAGRNIAYSNTSVNGSFNAGVNVFNGFGDVASLRQARYSEEAGDLTYDRTRQNVVFNVATMFVELVNAREQIQIQQENLEAQRQQLAQIEEFTRVGARPISDLFQQQAQVAQAELQVLNAERSAQIAKTQLIQVVQLDPFGEYEFVTPDVAEGALQLQQYELNQLLQAAFAQRADIRAQQARIEAAEQGIRVARSSYWPTVDLGYNLRSNFSPDDDGSLMDQLDINRGTEFGFRVSVPIFDQFNRGTNVQRAQVNYRNAELELQDMQQEVALQVRQAYLDYLTNQKRLEVTEKQVAAAEQALEAERERYNVGAATLVELSQAQATYVQAASNQAQARYDFIFQGKLIDYYVGRLDPSQPLLP